jgi:hypothetical protein
MTENTFTKIATFSYSSEAIILKGKIESEGIAVFMFDNNTVDTDPMISNAIGGVKLFVYSENTERATKIVEEFNEFNVDYSTEKSNTKSENITSIKSLFKYLKNSVANLLD